MARKSNYEAMSYDALVTEKQKIAGQINELKATSREIQGWMDKKSSEVKIKRVVDNLSPDEKVIAKDMLNE